MQEETKQLREDPALKKERRGIEKVITLNVQQISASKQQVSRDFKPFLMYMNVVDGFLMLMGAPHVL